MEKPFLLTGRVSLISNRTFWPNGKRLLLHLIKLKVVYHLVVKAGWSKVEVNGTQQNPNVNFHGMCVFHFHGHFYRDEYKPKILELVAKANGTHPFRLGIPFGNFGLPFKKSRFPRKFSVWEDQIGLSIYIPTESSHFPFGNSV